MDLAQKMVHHNRSIINTKEAVRNLDIIVRFLRQPFHLMAQLIAEITDSSADERKPACIFQLIFFQ